MDFLNDLGLFVLELKTFLCCDVVIDTAGGVFNFCIFFFSRLVQCLGGLNPI